MTLIRHELRQNKISLLIWTLALASFLMICIVIFPEIKPMMAQTNDLYASMGELGNAYNMESLDLGILKDYYAVESSSILGLGGALFAALAGIAVLAREEKNGTAEFLLTHPITRTQVAAQKLISVVIRIVVLNLAVFLLCVGATAVTGEPIPWREMFLIHLTCFLMQLEIACICFGLSACMSRGSIGVGLGLAIGLYFINLIANLTDSLAFLKYITPFSYAEGTQLILPNATINTGYLLVGIGLTVAGVILGFWKYARKDIR